MGTLADLVQGFQGGYTGVQDARRKRKLNQAIDYELEGMEQKRRGRNAGVKRLGYGNLATSGFQMPQTYGEKLVGKIKGMFGASTGQQNTTAIDPGMQPAGPQESGATTFPMPQRFRDGGAVRNMKGYANGGRSLAPDQSTAHGASRYHVENPLPGYANGGEVITKSPPGQMTPQNMGSYAIPTPNRMQQSANVGQALPGFADGGRAGRYVDPDTGVEFIDGVPQGDVPTSGGGVLEAAKDVGRNIGGNTRRRFSEWAPAGLAADQAVLDAEGAANVGGAIRRNVIEGARGIGEVGKGLIEDTSLASIAKGVGGFLGYGTDEAQAAEAEAAGPTQAIPTDDKGAAVASAVGAQPTGTPPNTQTPQAKAAAQPAGPPDEIIDFSQVRDVMPEDMPNHGVKDWEDERKFWAAQAISMGNDPFEAMKAVDQRQMRGFAQYGQQAFQMLQAGDATGAARALYAAYQYFPNGADVKFGVQKGKNGQPVLIGMGTDEETGEPLKKGKPMVITPESLSVQIENLSNPAAFRTWTKDWRSAEQEIREYNEVTKKEAESNARYRDRAGRAALINADAAQNRALKTGTGGLKQTDLDRANSAFTEAVALESFENEEQAGFMMSLMAEIYQRHGGTVQYPTVIDDVQKAIRSGDFTELDQKYGQ